MKITKASFHQNGEFNALYYTANKKDHAVPLPKSELLQLLKESGFISDHNGADILISIIDESETWMPLGEFIPLMSDKSWNEVATHIENTKTESHAG